MELVYDVTSLYEAPAKNEDERTGSIKLSFATIKRQGKCSGFSSIKLCSACNYVSKEHRSNIGHSNSGIFKKALNKLSSIKSLGYPIQVFVERFVNFAEDLECFGP